MPRLAAPLLKPRKTPLQARSTASVDAIVHATLQVLVAVGKDRLTTTRVARRAGVSVGTLYQYFPNKSSLLQAAIRDHLETMAREVEQVCCEQHGRALPEMAATLVTKFLTAKMRDPKASVALYAVSEDVDAHRIVRELAARITFAIAAMLASSPEPLTTAPDLVAGLVYAMLAGVSRRLVESDDPPSHLGPLCQELIRAVSAYLAACT